MTYLIDIRLANNFFCKRCLLFSEWASFLFGEYVINVCILSGNSGKVHCSAHLFAHYSVYRFVKVFGRERVVLEKAVLILIHPVVHYKNIIGFFGVENFPMVRKWS